MLFSRRQDWKKIEKFFGYFFLRCWQKFCSQARIKPCEIYDTFWHRKNGGAQMFKNGEFAPESVAPMILPYFFCKNFTRALSGTGRKFCVAPPTRIRGFWPGPRQALFRNVSTVYLLSRKTNEVLGVVWSWGDYYKDEGNPEILVSWRRTKAPLFYTEHLLTS